MRASFPGFPSEALRFFRELKRNNEREWFRANKETFDQKVKLPMMGLIMAIGTEMRRIAPEISFDPRNIYRIYRDTRFSNDKSPYKTQIAASFNPARITRHAGAGLYFHVSPDELLVAGGVYMPGPEELRAIRRHIAANHRELRRIVSGARFKKLFGGLSGEQLKRAPQGFPLEHPAIDLLRYKQFLAWTEKPPALAESPKLLPFIVEHFRAMLPLIRFLNTPLKTR
jgi:uncharacterized protein (TIGR02453 family)